jgi:hypothetical protein
MKSHRVLTRSGKSREFMTMEMKHSPPLLFKALKNHSSQLTPPMQVLEPEPPFILMIKELRLERPQSMPMLICQRSPQKKSAQMEKLLAAFIKLQLKSLTILDQLLPLRPIMEMLLTQTFWPPPLLIQLFLAMLLLSPPPTKVKMVNKPAKLLIKSPQLLVKKLPFTKNLELTAHSLLQRLRPLRLPLILLQSQELKRLPLIPTLVRKRRLKISQTH